MMMCIIILIVCLILTDKKVGEQSFFFNKMILSVP